MDRDEKTSRKQTPLGQLRFRAVLTRLLRSTRIRVSLPFISYEIAPEDFLEHPTLDQRLQRLSSIKADLQASILAVEELEREAFEKKREVNELEGIVQRLNEDKTTTESLLRLPEETFIRVLSRAATKGRWRGILEGSVIGFLTGTASSFLVWYLTRT